MGTLITISREYGSGGRCIGRLVAEKLGIPLFDREIIEMASERSGLSPEIIETAELRARSSLSYTFASAMTFGETFAAEPISVNEKLFIAQSDVIRQIAKSGDGVIVGRCADYILEDVPGVTNVFIYAEMEDKIKRCVEMYNDDPSMARKIVEDYGKARVNYYNFHTGKRWGNYANYNLAINTSYISDEESANLIVEYVKKRLYK
ncbi:MAG: cytidylate kinase-like family protein [Eubacterium sp.]|nr:cytidylate kinase-like family protein [Eubacterium sp.]